MLDMFTIQIHAFKHSTNTTVPDQCTWVFILFKEDFDSKNSHLNLQSYQRFLSKIHATEIGELRKIGHFGIVPSCAIKFLCFLIELNPNA